jgi:hypothetical protein
LQGSYKKKTKQKITNKTSNLSDFVRRKVTDGRLHAAHVAIVRNKEFAYLEVVCYNALLVAVWWSTFFTFFKRQLIVKVNENAYISPSIIAYKVLCDCIFIRKVRNSFT